MRAGWAPRHEFVVDVGRFCFVALSLIACSGTVGSVYPVSADHARHKLPGSMQRAVETVLGAREDNPSSDALACLLSYDYLARVKKARLKALSDFGSERLLDPPRRPPIPNDGNAEAAHEFCEAAQRSENAAIAEIGRAYNQRVLEELSFDAERGQANELRFKGIETMLEAGDTNAAYRRLVYLRPWASTHLQSRLDVVEARYREPLAAERAFEDQAEIRLLRRREARLDEEIEHLTVDENSELVDVRQVIAHRHRAFLAQLPTAPMQ